MNILLLNRNFDPSLTRRYSEVLQREGHKITILNYLEDAKEYKRENPACYLSRFDVALAHPSGEDAKALYEELGRRKRFRVIIFNIYGKSEMGGRLLYETPLDSSSLIALIEGKPSA